MMLVDKLVLTVKDKFECIWSKEVKVAISGQGDIKNKKRVEKLFKVR